MATTTKTTEEKFNGNGTQTAFSFQIELLRAAPPHPDLKIYVDSVLKIENTDYTISGSTVTFNTAPPSGVQNVIFTRRTDLDSAAGIFAAGSSIRALDLNNNQDQVLFALQEAQRGPEDTTGPNAPLTPVNGDRWYDTTSGRLFVYYVTDTAAQWVESSPAFDIANEALSFTQSGTGAVTRTLSGKLQETISVKDFGVVGNGVTNDTVNIQKAFDATPDNGILFFPQGSYLITSQILVTNKNIHIRAYGAIFLINANIDAFRFDNYSDAESVLLSSNYTKGGLSIPVNALSAALTQGKIFKVTSNSADIYNNDEGSSANQHRTGEWVAAKGGTTTSITLHTPLRFTEGVSTTSVAGEEPKEDSYTTSNKTRVTIPKVRTVTWHGGEIKYEEGHDADAWDGDAITLHAVTGAVFDNVKVSRGYAKAVTFNGCVNCTVENSYFENLTNNTSQSQYGYGVDDTGSIGTHITNCKFNNTRHGQTTTGLSFASVQNTTPTSNELKNLLMSGRTQAGLVSNCIGTGAIESVYSTHQDAHDYVFTDCVAESGELGFSFRGTNITAQGCKSINCARGFKFFTMVDNAESDDDVFTAGKPEGFTTGQMKNCISKGAGFDGVPVSATDCAEVLIENCIIEHARNSLILAAGSLIKLGGNNILIASKLEDTNVLTEITNQGIFDINPVDTLIKKSQHTIATSAVNTSTNVITSTAHGFNDGDKVRYSTGDDDQTPHTPIGGLTDQGTFFIRDKTADTFKLALTKSGNAISFTSTGDNAQYITYLLPEVEILDGATVQIDASEMITAGSNTFRLASGTGGSYLTVNGTVRATLSTSFDQLLPTTLNTKGDGKIYWNVIGAADNSIQNNLLGRFIKAESLDGTVVHDWVTPNLKAVSKRENDAYTLTTSMSTQFIPEGLGAGKFLKSTVTGKSHRFRYSINWLKTNTNDTVEMRIRCRSDDDSGDEVDVAGSFIIPQAATAAKMIIDCFVYNDSGTDKQDWTVTFLPDGGAVDVRKATTTVNFATNTSATKPIKIAAKCASSTGDILTMVDHDVYCDLLSDGAD